MKPSGFPNRLTFFLPGSIFGRMKPSYNKNFVMVVGGVLIYFGLVFALSIALAVRDAENAADFVFKVFGASMALIIASAGPFGIVGLALMQGVERKITLVAAMVFSGCMSVGLTVYVLYRLGAFSLFL